MPGRSKTVKEYLKELKDTRREKPAQVKEALEIYSELWETVIEKGIVSDQDEIDEALSKIDAKGGLHQAASG